MGDGAQTLLMANLLLFALLLWLAARASGLTAKILLLAALLCVLPALRHQDAPAESYGSIEKTVFTEAKLNQLRNTNQVVLVNMTADWCITCKVNEQVAFRSQELQALLTQPGVHYLVGDWTNKNAAILRYLNRYQRSGVPLYVVYAGNISKQVLPQLLTPQIVIDALQTAQKELTHEE
jgi:thiol:disulfide interchange protein DsbD